VWMHYQVSKSLSPVIQSVVAAAVDALQQLPATTRDRKQFQRSFGQLYVLDSPLVERAVRPEPRSRRHD